MAGNVLFAEADVVPWLTRMRLPQDVLLNIFEMTLAERSNVTASDPVTTPGTELWRWAIRFSRDDLSLRELGWVACWHDQIEGIRNDDLKIKLAFSNTDTYTGIPSKTPRNVSDKGPSAVKLIAHNSGQKAFDFFQEPSVPEPEISNNDFWYFCLHASDKSVAAEISRPDLILGNTIRSFSHRIILCQPGQMGGLRRRDPVPEEFAQIEKPKLIRKS